MKPQIALAAMLALLSSHGPAHARPPLSPEGMLIWQSFWKERAGPAALQQKHAKSDRMKALRAQIVAELNSSEPDMKRVFRLIDEEDLARRADQIAAKATFRELLSRLSPSDQAAYLREQYTQLPPPVFNLSPAKQNTK